MERSLWLGNGGSAATASHLACDLAKNIRAAGLPPFSSGGADRQRAIIDRLGQRCELRAVFAEQLVALVRPGDVVVLISASGNSPNVLATAEAASDAGATVIGLTGASGGALLALSDLAVCVPGGTIEQVEDAHLAVAHGVCVALRERLQAESLALAEQLEPIAMAVGSKGGY